MWRVALFLGGYSLGAGVCLAVLGGIFLLVLTFLKRDFSLDVSLINYCSTIFFKWRIKRLICVDILWLTLNMRGIFCNALHYTLFLISSTFISNARLKLAKNQANGKQHPEAEILTSENYWHSSSTLSSKNKRTYSKK